MNNKLSLFTLISLTLCLFISGCFKPIPPQDNDSPQMKVLYIMAIMIEEKNSEKFNALGWRNNDVNFYVQTFNNEKMNLGEVVKRVRVKYEIVMELNKDFTDQDFIEAFKKLSDKPMPTHHTTPD